MKHIARRSGQLHSEVQSMSAANRHGVGKTRRKSGRKALVGGKYGRNKVRATPGKIHVTQYKRNGEVGLDPEISQCDVDLKKTKKPTMDEAKKLYEKKIRDFAGSEYARYGGNQSYTPYYKAARTPRWKQTAYRICEDIRCNNDPGHVRMTTQMMNICLQNFEVQEGAKRSKALQDINSRRDLLIQRVADGVGMGDKRRGVV